ncbi:hypothetical protein [Sphingomonas sp.]|uniref:hypothetical protein n=1 Tax=Sphingomonas sp. TaxID=28214 RepID=UPI003B3BB0CC
MVRALLDGRKTQTRRLATSPLRRCKVGDRLYVRESIYLWSTGHDCEITFAADGSTRQTGPNTGEIPDAALAAYFKMADRSVEKRARISRPSIHMPRWTSRLTLTVEDVRVERLRAISEADAEAEGCVWDSADGYDVWYVPGAQMPRHGATAAECYSILWDSLHSDPGQRWQDNPEIVALTFRVVRGNIDQLARAA